MKDNVNTEFTVDIENLAVPEVHTGKVSLTESEKAPPAVQYETVAVPEINISTAKDD